MTEPGSFKWATHAGLAATLVGSAMVLLNNVFAPQRGGALLTGGGIGLVVTGVRMLRSGPWAHAHPRTRSAMWLWVPALFAASMALLFQSQADIPVDTELTAQVLPGYRISLPAWTVGHAGTSSTMDVHRLEDPKGNGRFVEVRWSLGSGAGTDVTAAMLKSGVVSTRAALSIARRH